MHPIEDTYFSNSTHSKFDAFKSFYVFKEYIGDRWLLAQGCLQVRYPAQIEPSVTFNWESNTLTTTLYSTPQWWI